MSLNHIKKHYIRLHNAHRHGIYFYKTIDISFAAS